MDLQHTDHGLLATSGALARKGLQVAYTIGEASNMSVLKGLSALALLVLDICEVRFSILSLVEQD